MNTEDLDGRQTLARTMDACRRVTLMLPLAHVLDDIPMRGPSERLARVVVFLEDAMHMTDGGAFEFRALIRQLDVASELNEQLALRRPGASLFVPALAADHERDAAPRATGALSHG